MALLFCADDDNAAAAKTTSASVFICKRLLDFLLNRLFGPPAAADPQPPPPPPLPRSAAIILHPHSSLSSSSSASSNSISPSFSSSSSSSSEHSTSRSSSDSVAVTQEISPRHDDVSGALLALMHTGVVDVPVSSSASFGDAAFFERLFELIDVDKNGRVSVNEMHCFLQKLGLQLEAPSSSSSSLDGLSSVFRSFINYVHFPDYVDELEEDALDLDISRFQDMYAWLFSSEGNEGVEVGFSRGLQQKPKLVVTEQRRSEWTSSSSSSLSGAEVEKEDDWDEIEEAFRVYDKDGNGYISASELATVLKQLDLLPTPSKKNDNNNIMDDDDDEDPDALKACQRLIDRVDTNGDGVIDIHEFRSMLLLRRHDHHVNNHDHDDDHVHVRVNLQQQQQQQQGYYSRSPPPDHDHRLLHIHNTSSSTFTTTTSSSTSSTTHDTNLLPALTRALPALLASLLSGNLHHLLKHFPIPRHLRYQVAPSSLAIHVCHHG